MANIAAEAAMLAPCLRDILPKMERHKCHAKYLRRNRHSTSTTCLMKYKCALLWCLEGVPVPDAAQSNALYCGAWEVHQFGIGVVL